MDKFVEVKMPRVCAVCGREYTGSTLCRSAKTGEEYHIDRAAARGLDIELCPEHMRMFTLITFATGHSDIYPVTVEEVQPDGAV